MVRSPASTSQKNSSASATLTPAHTSRSPPTSPPLTPTEIEKKPWKYIGYRGYANLVASDDDFYILRRFATINARVALCLQDQISALQTQLEYLDDYYSRREVKDVHNGAFREDQNDRAHIMEELTKKLTRYNKFVLQQTELKKYPQASLNDIESIRNWHYNHDDLVINAPEMRYIECHDDLIQVLPKNKSPLRRLLDRSHRFRTHRFWKAKKAPQLPIYDQADVVYVSDRCIDRFVTTIIIGVGTIMLVAPMWILQAVHNVHYKLAIITSFIVVFLSLMSYMTTAKPLETLAAAAAYSAVLMVFLQIGGIRT